MPYTDAMVDIESLSTSMTATVLSIGAVLFNIADNDTVETLDDPERTLYIKVDAQAQIDAGRKVDYSTISWWVRQNKLAQNEAFSDEQGVLPVVAVMRLFSSISGVERWWGNGSGFDLSILRNLAEDNDVAVPIRYSADMDLRTLRMLSGATSYPKVSGLTGHNPVDDCKYQIICAQEYWRKICASTVV